MKREGKEREEEGVREIMGSRQIRQGSEGNNEAQQQPKETIGRKKTLCAKILIEMSKYFFFHNSRPGKKFRIPIPIRISRGPRRWRNASKYLSFNEKVAAAAAAGADDDFLPPTPTIDLGDRRRREKNTEKMSTDAFFGILGVGRKKAMKFFR